MQLLSLPIILVATVLSGQLLNPFHLSMHFWLPTIMVIIGFYPLNAFLYIYGLKHGELTKTVPLQGLAPVFSILLSMVFLHQFPTVFAVLGITVTICGVYVLSLTGRTLCSPFKLFKDETAALYTIAGILLVVAVGVLDAIAIKASSAPVYFSFVTTLGAIPILYASAKMSGVRERVMIKSHLRQLSLAGATSAGSYVAYTLALVAGPLAYVGAVRGSTAMIMGIASGMVYFHERLTRQKVIAATLIITGSTIIVLFG